MQDGMTPLRVAGARKVADGLTTAEEVLKVTAAMLPNGTPNKAD
jgi:general secretion pathway protein E